MFTKFYDILFIKKNNGSVTLTLTMMEGDMESVWSVVGFNNWINVFPWVGLTLRLSVHNRCTLRQNGIVVSSGFMCWSGLSSVQQPFVDQLWLINGIGVVHEGSKNIHTASIYSLGQFLVMFGIQPWVVGDVAMGRRELAWLVWLVNHWNVLCAKSLAVYPDHVHLRPRNIDKWYMDMILPLVHMRKMRWRCRRLNAIRRMFNCFTGHVLVLLMVYLCRFSGKVWWCSCNKIVYGRSLFGLCRKRVLFQVILALAFWWNSVIYYTKCIINIIV